MKISLALGNRKGLSRQTAWGCLTTNLALPGFGSILAGRPVGYFQAALCVAGLALTMILGTRFIAWSLANWSRLHGPQADAYAAMVETFRAARGSLLGIAVFGLSWVWALISSFGIVRSARADERSALPPRL